MDKRFEPLFTPWKIGNVEIKNRIVMTSMGGTCLFGWMEPNHFDKEAAKLLLEVAKNDCGLILPGIAPIRDVMGNKWLYSGKGKFKKLAVYMEEFHKTGSKLFVQITAGFGRSFASTHLMEMLASNKFLGTIMKPFINISWLTASASSNPNRWSDKTPSRPLRKEEIKKMVEGFALTAKLCKDAGVDGIEVHAVHEGYLLDQFTLPYTNQRTDEYGGSFENRYRFPVEIVKAIKKACGHDFPVSLRYSVVSKTKGFRKGALPGEKYEEVGRDIIESIKAAKYLQEAGYDMLNCDNGTYDAWYWAHPPGYMPLNCNLPEAEIIKKEVSIPVVVAGRMEPLKAATEIKEGRIDAVGIARQFLADPTWITKLKEERLEDIRPCICCHNGCFNLAHYEGVGNDQPLSDTMGMCRCAVNPSSMQSKKYKIKQAKKKLHIAVIGGGIGGMEVARVATLRGHKVTIYEKTSLLGGVFIPASNFSFKEKDKMLLEWYRNQIKKLNIEVKLNTPISDIKTLKEDKVVIATGAKPKVLQLKGLETSVSATEYLSGKEVGENVLIVGGSLTGCEIALDLFNKGKKPVIVEMKNDLIAVKGVCLANSSYLREFFSLNKVPVYLNSTVKEIENKEALIQNKQGEIFKVKFDDVIVCIGYDETPLTSKGKLVGDCYKVGNLLTAIWRAWDVAMKL